MPYVRMLVVLYIAMQAINLIGQLAGYSAWPLFLTSGIWMGIGLTLLIPSSPPRANSMRDAFLDIGKVLIWPLIVYKRRGQGRPCR